MPRQKNQNRLVSMTSLHNDKPRTRKLEFAYDWMGRRIEKKVSDEISSAMTLVDKRRFAYDRWNMIAEFTVDGSGNLVPDRHYTWGTDISGRGQRAGGVGGLLSVSNGGTPLIACYDGNGNIVAWMNASGTAVAKQEYDPFGNQIIHEGVEMPVGFSTKYKDKETGLLYYGYRYFDPKAGRWLSKDPIGENGGDNLYGFASNDGLSVWDYLGMKGSGHHMIPWSLFNDKVNAEVQKFLDGDAARIFNEYYINHNSKTLGGISHVKYTKLVKESLDEFLGEQAIKEMTLEQAKNFLNKIKNASPKSGIGAFNAGVADEAVRALKEGLAEAAKKAAGKSLAAAISNGATKAATKIGKRAGPMGLAVSAAFLVSDANANEVSVREQLENDLEEEAELNLRTNLTYLMLMATGKIHEWGAKVCSED